MRKTTQFAVLACILLAGFLPAQAGIPGKTELTFSGSYVNPDDGKAVWKVGVEPLFPITPSGIVVAGPGIQASDSDTETALGAVLEFNIPGQKGGFFVGATYFRFLDSDEEQEDDTAAARAGIKLPISSSGLFKVYVSKGFSGREEDADWTGNLAAVIKF